jgi:hypothetical protein
MKFKEMPTLHKVVLILIWLCLFALLAVFLCSISGVLPGLYENPLFNTLCGIVLLGQAILNWKKQRVQAIFNLVTAFICFVALCCWFTFTLIIR